MKPGSKVELVGQTTLSQTQCAWSYTVDNLWLNSHLKKYIEYYGLRVWGISTGMSEPK